MKEKIIQCFSNLGIIISDESSNIELDEYIVDSVTFVSFLVELEQQFEIEIDDDYLVQGSLKTLNDVENMIEELLAKKNSSVE